MDRRATAVAIGLVVAACGRDAPQVVPEPAGAVGPPARPQPDDPAAPRGADRVPMSDPAEYRIERVSWAAGEAIFTRTGIGDPYRTGVPYPIFLALLRAYPDLLGADVQQLARRFGFVARAAEPGSADLDLREGLPLGMHLTVDPYTDVPFVMHNCALCHAERVRWPGGEALVVGLGNKRVAVHAYDAAFADAAGRPDFDADRIAKLADAAAGERGITWPSDYRVPLVRATVDGLRKRARDRRAYLDRVRGGPPGRVAAIEAFALAIGAAVGRDVTTGPHVGWTKVPDVVGFPVRTTLSWDAAGEGPMDVLVVEADFAAGVRPAWFWAHPLQGASLGAYLRQPRRALPFPGRIDRALADRGRARFGKKCSMCHGTYEPDGRVRAYEEDVVPLADLGTDPARADALSDDFVAAANDPDLTHGLVRTRRTGGYVPPVLTSVWARGPFGHAGQWPTLAILATLPEQRPTRLVIDLDAPYDLVSVGVAHRPPDGRPLAPGQHLWDATVPGFSVAGHPFLAELGPDAPAVIEYLKTL